MSTGLYAIDELPEDLAQLHKAVARWQLLPALAELSRLAWAESQGYPDELPPQIQHIQKFHQHNIAYLAKVIVTRCDQHRGKAPVASDIIAAMNASHQYFDQYGKDPFVTLNRIMAVQWRPRLSMLYEIVRAVEMFGRIPGRLNEKLQLDWGKMLQEICGFSATDLLIILAPFFVRYRGDLITSGQLWNAVRDTPGAKQKVASFLDAFSRTKGEFTKLVVDRQKVPAELEYYGYNPLYEAPLVRLSQNRFVVPSKNCFIYAATTGLFWKVRNYLCRMTGSDQTAADDDLGLLLETYCRDLMRYYLDDKDAIGEVAYDGKRWADAAIVKGDRGILVECKAHGFGLQALGTGQVAYAQVDLEKNLIKALSQAARCIREAQDAAKQEPRLARVESWLPLVVLHEAPVPLNWPDIRNHVLDQVAPDDRVLVQNYQASTASQFEDLMMASDSVHPVDLLYDKLSDEPRGPIRNYINERIGSREPNNGFFREGLGVTFERIAAKYEIE